MRKFTDLKGREWSITLTVSTIRRIKELAGVDLLDLASNPYLRMYENPVLLAEVLFAACKPDADLRNVAPEDFGDGLAGQPLEDATEALMREYADFFPHPAARANLHAVMDKTSRARDVAGAIGAERIKAMDVEAMVTKELIAGDASGNTPAS